MGDLLRDAFGRRARLDLGLGRRRHVEALVAVVPLVPLVEGEEAQRAEREFEGDDAYVAAAMRQILRHLEENVVKLQRGDWAGPGLLSLDQPCQ